MKRVHLLHKIEGMAITLATAGAASGLKHVELGIPLEKWGLYADLIAGGIALGHCVHSLWHRLKESKDGQAH